MAPGPVGAPALGVGGGKWRSRGSAVGAARWQWQRWHQHRSDGPQCFGGCEAAAKPLLKGVREGEDGQEGEEVKEEEEEEENHHKKDELEQFQRNCQAHAAVQVGRSRSP